MTFNPNIPLPTDLLTDSQGDIKDNFTSSNTSFGQNHYPLDNLTVNNGMHKFVNMPIAVAPFNPPTTVLNELALYTKSSAAGSELYMIRDGFPATETKLTLASSTFAAPLNASNGYTFLAGGIILQWGTLTNPGTSGSILFLPSNVDFPTSCFMVIPALQHASSGNESVTIQPSPSTTGFSYRTTSSSMNTVLYWWAVGK